MVDPTTSLGAAGGGSLPNDHTTATGKRQPAAGAERWWGEPLIFEYTSPGRRGIQYPSPPAPAQPPEQTMPAELLRKEPPHLPEVSELDVVRHYTRLSQLNYSIDTQCYPLGSCTMKYNPKVNDALADIEGFAKLHPHQPAHHCQGMLKLLKHLEQLLCEICGMDAFSLQPAAGAQGELVGLEIIRAYHTTHGNPRKVVLIPDSAHGTNPASAALCGYTVQAVPSGVDGLVDFAALKRLLNPDVAALMLTNPNTLGLFEREILEITKALHEVGALIYMDGANMNALLGVLKPGDTGVDIMHLNLHKTFSTPHGGGGPGAGPVGVKRALAQYLPVPRIEERDGQLAWSETRPQTIGRVRTFYGNVGILVRAYAYILTHGKEGLAKISRMAILNANYLRARLRGVYELPYQQPSMHEFVLSAARQKARGGSALDIAKCLLDRGFYAPTIYFPLIVDEALMIEPTETESLQTLDRLAAALVDIARLIDTDAASAARAPERTPVTRLDEVTAARQPDVRWTPQSTTRMPHAMRHL